MSVGRSGCIELVGVAVFALLVGAFAASTWLQHRASAAGKEELGAADSLAIAGPAINRSRIRVEVRNGSGIEGAAGRMTEFLRRQGFDVVDFGNADRFDHARTFVIDRRGDPSSAREVAVSLRGVPIETATDGSPYLDVTVVVGRDLETVLARRSAEPEEPRWRRWIGRLRRI